MVVIGNYRTHAELRKKPRRPFKYNARIAIAKGKPLVACLVKDISESGARIWLEKDEELPQIFTLLLTPKIEGLGDTRRYCQLLRRD
jgi:hypothetical protein